MKECWKDKVTNYPKLFYHGTDLRFVNIEEDIRKLIYTYCYYLREVLYRRFSDYYDIEDKDHKRLKELLGESIENTPKVFENLLEGLQDILMSKISEDYEYGALYLTSNLFYAHMYAEKAIAGGEFAFAAYALAKAARVARLQEWYLNEQLKGLDNVIDALILLAEGKPKPVIFKIPETAIEAELLRTEQNESIERYIQDGKLRVTDFRYGGTVNLMDYDFYVVDEDFKKRLDNDELE